MQKRSSKLILAGVATLSVGIGLASTVSAATSGHDDKKVASLSNVDKAGAVAELPAKKAPAKTSSAKPKPAAPKALLTGTTRGSYFWDTGHSGNGDTGAPASGLPMQEGCFASPSWPMGTKGYIEYQGKKHNFFICDRGPGTPSHRGVMLDIDGKTYAKLTGGKWSEPDVIGGSGQSGNIKITYHVTKWGSGAGKRGVPQPL